MQKDIKQVTDVTPIVTNTIPGVEPAKITNVSFGADGTVMSMTVSNSEALSGTGRGIVAVYHSDGTLKGVVFSENTTEHAASELTFSAAVSCTGTESFKAFIWAAETASMKPLTEVYDRTLTARPSAAVSTAPHIIIGTPGSSKAIDDMAANGILDVSAIKGKWESFLIKQVGNHLVIAGSDKRGTIYGIYDLSEKIGVSPWNWWADAAPIHADTLYVNLQNNAYTEGEPSVKYRGIFLNDEYNLNRWSASQGSGYMNTQTYEKVFELLLRLKSNYLRPAMHDYSPSFNSNSENTRLAELYGIVLGSSHCEMLLRNNVWKWDDYANAWAAAQEYADIQNSYYRLGNSRRPEHLVSGLYNLYAYGDEGQSLIDSYKSLTERSEALYNTLSEDKKPAFYELQLYPLRSCYQMAVKYIAADKSILYHKQNRGTSVNKYGSMSDTAYRNIETDTAFYNSMLNGKWKDMMNPYPAKLVGSFGGNISKLLTHPTVTEVGYTDLGIAVEGQSDLSVQPPLKFSGYTKDVRFIDIFNTGSGSINWRASTDAD